MDNTLKYVIGLFAVIIVICIAVLIGGAGTATTSPGDSYDLYGPDGHVAVYFFYGAECPHCHNVMPFMENLTAKYSDVDFQYIEVWHNATNETFFESMNKKRSVSGSGVPEVIVGKTVLIGEKDIPDQLEAAITAAIKKNH